MPGELLIAAGPGEWRAALLENGVPVELYVERGDRSEAGSIHLGRVRRLAPALGAVLVDIDDARPAFLPEGEVLPRGRRLDEGERVVVQVRREAHSGKAARLTTRVTLHGGLIELRPGRPGLVGGELLSPQEADRLLATLTHSAPTSTLPRSRGREGWGLRLLQPAPIEAMATEAADLLQRWRDILDRASRLSPPARLDPALSFAAALAGALPAAPDLILTDDPAVIPEIRAAFSAVSAQHGPEAGWPIDLDEVFDQALSGTVALAGGGSIHIETTRAAVLIDVDSGTPEAGSAERTRLAVNLAAADAITRQIRLRNLGGGIVVDFIGLEDRRMRERLRSGFSEALAADPARPQILGWTRLGHFELVRPWRGRPLAEALLEPRPGGPLVKTALTVAHDALRALRREARAQPGRKWRLTVGPEVGAALAGVAFEERFGRRIDVATDATLDRERFQIAPA